MGKVIATDLDGTLFYPKKRISMIPKDSLAFLRRHIDNGGRVVLISGRNYESLKKTAERIDRPVDMIGCNSSYIVADSRFIKKTYFDSNKLREVLDEIEKKYSPKAFMLMSDDGQFVSRQKFKSIIYRIVYKIWLFQQGVYKEPFEVNKEKYEDILSNGHVYKVMIFFGVGKKNVNNCKEANKIIREEYGNCVESSWSNEFIELSPHGCSKSEGLKYYLDYFKINHSDVYVVGDSGNDISMFTAFPERSFCMSHASLSVSKYAKHTLKRFADLENYIDIERNKENE
ncbi:MAG: HAD family hydrolase [Bacilli bacterium]|nr:HAD family hydrolase [Bacilli bacterium]